MPLPTCDCARGAPVGEQLSNIYCALYTLATGGESGLYLLKANNLSDVPNDATARANIGAAASGANTDITSLGGVLTIGSGGAVPSAATYPKVIAFPTADFVVPVGVGAVTIAGFTEILDTAGVFNPATGEITIQASAAGTYLTGVSVAAFSGGTTSTVIMSVFVNGAEVSQITNVEYVAGSSPTSSAVTVIQLNGGDVVTWRAAQNGGTSWTLLGGFPQICRFSLLRQF